MSELERALLAYYLSKPIVALTTQEIDELLFLEIKLGLEHWEAKKGGTKCRNTNAPTTG